MLPHLDHLLTGLAVATGTATAVATGAPPPPAGPSNNNPLKAGLNLGGEATATAAKPATAAGPAAPSSTQGGAAKKVLGPARPPPKREHGAPAAAVGRGGRSDDTEAEWQPPQGQTGDGKTALNAKLGY